MHREEKEIEVQKALHNLMSRIEKLSPKFQNPKIDEKYFENYGNKELHHDQSGIQESQSDSRTQFEINVLSDQDKMKSKNSTWSQDSSTSRKIDPKINLNAILTDKNLSKEDLMEIIASAVGKGSTSTSSSNRGDEMRDVSDSETESRISERRKKSLADDESNIQYTKLNDTIGRDNKKSDYSSTGEFQSLQPKRSVEEGSLDKSVSGFNRSDKSERVMTDNYNNDGDDYDHRSYQTDDSKFRNKFASNPLNDRERERREISSGSDPYSRPMSRSLEGSLDSSKLRDRASNDTKFSNVSKSLENEKYAFDDNPRNVEKSKKSESLDQYRANEEETEVRNRRGIQEKENWYSPESDREKAMSSNSPQRESVGHRVVFRNSSKESSKESSGQLAEYDRLTSTDKDRYLKETDHDNDNDREHVNRGQYDRDDVKESERRSRDIPSSRGSKSTSSSASMPSRNNPYSANLSGSTSVSPRTSPIRTKLSSGIVGKSSGILKREDRALSPSESDRTASLRAGRTRSSIQTSNSPIRYASNRTPDSTYSVRSTSTSGGTRLAEDPIREVLSRFLDIYQNDQNQIKSTLEKLALPGDQKFKMNSSAAQTNVIKNDQRSDFEVRKQELFDDDRDSISTRNHAKDKDDNNNLRNRRSLAENDVEVKNAMYVGQHNSNRRSSPTQEAENLSRANELFSRYGEGEIYNYNDHNKENRNNDNDGTNNNYHDNHVDYNDDVRKKINDNYNDKKIFNDNSNDNDREKIINHSYRNENNNDNDHNVSYQADFHDRRSNVESNYRNTVNDVGNFSSKSRVGYERNRVSDGEEEEEYQNYDNNDSTNSRLRQKKRKSLSQFRQKKPQLSLSPKRDSRSSVSSVKRSSSTGRRTSDVTDEKHSYLKSANNGCSSSLKKPNVSHWLPNKVRIRLMITYLMIISDL